MSTTAGSEDLVLQIDDHPAEADVAVVDDGLERFTLAAGGHEAPRPLAVFARASGRVVAGIRGWTWGQCCELVSLWVSEPRRHEGIGRKLLAAAEDEARRRGCAQVVVFTHANQAPASSAWGCCSGWSGSSTSCPPR